ncbi:hypothetical protein F8388_025753 [Cannabis sativa]|uniref:Uncharacterized protein n=1 Tax=Cannabis sativa TaxID=3483 RepID=A0A7J6F9N8_CANSA|nr:hypothetical protein F8388_025753 [Cannabis sativa]
MMDLAYKLFGKPYLNLRLWIHIPQKMYVFFKTLCVAIVGFMFCNSSQSRLTRCSRKERGKESTFIFLNVDGYQSAAFFNSRTCNTDSQEEDLSPTVVALLVCGVRDLLKDKILVLMENLHFFDERKARPRAFEACVVRWKKVSVFLCAQWKNFKSSHHLIKNALLIFEN